VRRLRVRHVVAGVALVAAVALALVAFGPDTDPNDVLDSAVAEAVDASRNDGPEGVARVFRAYEHRLDRSDHTLLVEAGLDEIHGGELGPEYVEALDEDDGATAAFVGFVGMVQRGAAERSARRGPPSTPRRRRSSNERDSGRFER
jgi:hypothetical protein